MQQSDKIRGRWLNWAESWVTRFLLLIAHCDLSVGVAVRWLLQEQPSVVPWPNGFESQPSPFFFHPKSGLRDIFPWNFETKFDKVQWRKSVQTLDGKKSDTAGDWTHDQLMLNDGHWQEKAHALTTEPSELWEESCIYLISAFIFTFSSFLKKVNT